jgi:beta-glucanase (GH16 family)
MSRWIVLVVVSLSGWCLVGLGSAHAASSSESVPTDDCGAVPPSKPGGGRWECTFADEFDGDRLDRSKWTPQTHHSSGTDDARACNVDDPRNVSVSDGALRLTVREASKSVDCGKKQGDYTAGNISTYHKFSQQYGRFEARIKSADATMPGLQEAFWLWPDDRASNLWWLPMSGEIDVAETYSHQPKLAIPYLHYLAIDSLVSRPGHNTAWDCKAERGTYNTYTLTWTRRSLTIDVNGETCLVNRSGNRAFNKPYIAAFTSALGQGRNELTNETPLPATMSVDYFRVWR